MRLLFLVLLLTVSNTASADLQADAEMAKYRLNVGGDLLIDVGTCLHIKKRLLDTASEVWQTTEFGWTNGVACESVNWSVKPSGSKFDRPTYYYRDQKFISTGDRIDVGLPCHGPPIKPCSRCDVRMLVTPKTYASCVSN
jgi:hypothetical protein